MARVRHLLVPSDGSAHSRRAARIAARLAKRLGARITALYVVPEGVPTLFSGDTLYGSGVLSPSVRALVRAHAAEVLAAVEREARAAKVPCTSVKRLARRPWRAIVGTARARGCELIVMGSHGRGAAAGLLLGSQTTRVLAHSRIPVLVCR